MSYKYLVFGAGMQGTAAIYDLIVNCEAREVGVVEPGDIVPVSKRLWSLLGKKADCIKWLTSDPDMGQYDVVLGCAPYQANLKLTEMALKAKKPFCDLGGHPETVAEQQKMADGTETPIVPDCGVSPGLSNIMAVHLARQGCESIRVRCGGLPQVPYCNHLKYKLLFNPWGLISEYSGVVPVIENGKISTVPALSETEEFRRNGDLHEYECSPTSNNSPQVVEYLRSLGVSDYNYMTIRYAGHWDIVRGWKSLGYFCGDREADKELADRLLKIPDLQWDADGCRRDKLILSVQGEARRPLRRHSGFSIEVRGDDDTGFTAMELTTSWGITIIAHHMAVGRGRPKGFATPERFVDTDWVISEVERRLP